MGTSFEMIETKAMMYIKNDISLDQDLATRLPVFYNRMKAYLMAGKSYFNKPPKMQHILSSYTEPLFNEAIYVSDSAQEAPATLTTGVTGYEIVSAGIIENDVYGNPQYTELPVKSYDPLTGDVRVDAGVKAQEEVTLDFYKGGSFDADLDDEQIAILAYCVYVAWELRFENNAIERTAKIRDSGFTPISEASQMDANTNRNKQVMDILQDWLRRYEQNQKYLDVVGI
jgi:hypothetical protein